MRQGHYFASTNGLWERYVFQVTCDTFLLPLQFILVANVYENEVLKSTCQAMYGFDDGSGRIMGYRRETVSGYPTSEYSPSFPDQSFILLSKSTDRSNMRTY